MKNIGYLTSEDIKAELKREKHKIEYKKTLTGTIYILLTVAAISILIATLWLPILQVTGTSMEPNLKSGQIVLAKKNAKFKQKDIIAFYYNNKILIKRVIGVAGDQISIDKYGEVYVNGINVEEPYVSGKSLGECDLKFPYQVPDGKFFVMGDHRSTSIDSRSSSIGCISDDFIVGKIIIRIWPLLGIGA